MLLCHTGLALSSSVAGFGVSLPSVSFLLRSSFAIFVFSLFVCPRAAYTLNTGSLLYSYSHIDERDRECGMLAATEVYRLASSTGSVLTVCCVHKPTVALATPIVESP